MNDKLLLVAFALFALGGGGSSSASDDEPPDDEPEDPPSDEELDEMEQDANSCDPKAPYDYEGPELAVPATTKEQYGMSQAEWDAAMTVLTRVINDNYISPWNRCNKYMVAKAARTQLSDIGALSMMVYWKTTGLGEPRPYPKEDADLDEQQKEQALLRVNKFGKFFVDARNKAANS